MTTPLHVHRLVAMSEHPARLLVWPEAPDAVVGGSCHADHLTDHAIRALEFLLRPLAPEDRARLGMVIGTADGCLEVDRLFDRSRRANPRFASPAAFSRTLPSTMLAELALHFGLTGPSLTVSCEHAPFALAVYRAAHWLEAFDLPFCVAGLVDQLAQRPCNLDDRQPIDAPAAACSVQFWLLSRQPSATAIGAFTVLPRPSAADLHKIGQDVPDLDAAWLWTPGEDYFSPHLRFQRRASGGDR